MADEPEMVERVARALDRSAWTEPVTGSVAVSRRRRASSLRKARAAIGAMAEPTASMVEAGVRQSTEFAVVPRGHAGEVQPVHPFTLRCCFTAMVDEALV